MSDENDRKNRKKKKTILQNMRKEDNRIETNQRFECVVSGIVQLPLSSSSLKNGRIHFIRVCFCIVAYTRTKINKRHTRGKKYEKDKNKNKKYIE